MVNKYKNRKHSERGFTTLFAVVILTLILLFTVLTLGQRGIAVRFMQLDLERKAQSEAYAHACVESARIHIANDPAYVDATGHLITVGDGNCFLFSVAANTPVSGRSRIQATSTVSGASTRYEVVVNSANANVVTWREVLSF